MVAVRPQTALLQIDLSAVCRNYGYVRSLLGEHVRLAAVVKSDAYGLGLVPVAAALARVGCPQFFVANVDEGALLRSACPDVEIAIFRDDIAKLLPDYGRHNLTPVANSSDDVQILAEARYRLPLMVQVETGFSRLGLDHRECQGAADALRGDQRRVIAVLSHLACSDLPGDGTNEVQRQRFLEFAGCFPSARASLAASAGVWLGSRYHFDMVRVGSALYGLNNARILPNPLASAVKLRAQVVHVHDVGPHEVVGYAATFRTRRRTRIAVAGIGYVQGLPWCSGNRSEIHVGGYSAPVIGRISMEYITVDVTDVPDHVCHPGVWIDLIDEQCGPDEFAEKIGVTPQELLVRLGSCCRRQYEGAPERDRKALHPSGRSNAAENALSLG